MEKTFAGGCKIAKSVKVFSLETFPLHSTILARKWLVVESFDDFLLCFMPLLWYVVPLYVLS